MPSISKSYRISRRGATSGIGLGDEPARLDLSLAERAELDHNDVGNAARILAVFGPDLIYVTGRGFAVWDGCRYSFADGDLFADGLATRLPEIIREEAEWFRRDWTPPDWLVDARQKKAEDRADTVKRLRRARAAQQEKWAVQSGFSARTTGALNRSKSKVVRATSTLDADPFALVVPGGRQVDLAAVARGDPPEACCVEVNRDATPTRCAGVAFDPAATAPAWDRFLGLVLPDLEVRAATQRLFGAMLFGRNVAQIMVVMRGLGGNGKSTFLAVLAGVLGRRDGYAAVCQVELLIRTRDKPQGAATPDEIRLPGARAYLATEPGERDALSGKKIKGLTGGDPRMSRGNYADFFEWTPTGVPVLSCNRVPQIVEADDGLRQRLVFVPFDAQLRESPHRREQAEVVAEIMAEAPGVLNWLLEGYRQFRAIGLAIPARMLELKAEIMAEADPVRMFLGELTVRAEGKRIGVGDFHKTLALWAQEEGHAVLTSTAVGTRMKELGFAQSKSNDRRAWRGLAWTHGGELWAAKATGSDCGANARAPLPDHSEVDDDPPPF